ncbi:MAG: oligoendopeptidase F [Clostridia bacterium]
MQVKERKDIDNSYKWNLEVMFANDAQWEKTCAELDKKKQILTTFDKKLNNAVDILACLQAESAIGRVISKLYVYAKMRQDQDVNISKYKAMTDKIENLSVEISTLASYIRPQLTENSEEFLLQLAADKRFVDYDYTLKELARTKSRTLSAKEESIIAQTGSFADMFQNAFSMFDNADVQFETFVDSNGEKVELSHGLYGLLMQSPVRDDRKKAFETMFTAYKKMINTVAVLYAGNVKKDLFYSKLRKYNNCLERAMDSENVAPIVYSNLIECVHNNIGGLYNYLEFRKKVMGYDELHLYDLHTPIYDGVTVNLDYADACKLVKDALAPMGKDYCDLLDRAFNERWIDVYENKGKRSGAYSWGCFDSHPYVLLNYQPTIHDVFTIAHELGHSLHSYFSNTTQPYEKAGYEIFVAEVASTVNETLLLKYLLARSDKKNRKYLLSYMLDMFRTTVFRQTQFAEFEVVAHDIAEKGDALTPDSLCDAYYKLNEFYYGAKGVINDEYIKYEWARIPHFYNSFYVYKYATGLISAVCIADDILTKGQPAVERYKQFLSAGGSMSPVEILKLAGVDLTTKEPFKKAMDFYNATLAELISLD